MPLSFKTRKKIVALLFFFILFLTFSPFSAEARGLVPCGGNDEPVCSLCHLIIGIDGIIDWGFTILVFIAILVIVIAGIMYIISTGNEQEMEKAKNMVKQALTGAIIVFGAWLIINTTITLLGPASTGITATGWSTFSCTPAVSEQIYVIPICGDGRCTGTETNATCQADCPPITEPPPTGTYTHAEAAAKLQAAGINVVSTGNCSDQNNKTCTSLQGIPTSAIDRVIQVKNTCPATVTVSGGTETGHKTHGTGKSVVDFSYPASPQLGACLKNNASTLGITKICTAAVDSSYRIGCNYNEPKRHWHVAF